MRRILVAALLLAVFLPRPAEAKRKKLKEVVAQTETIYLLPLSAEPFVLKMDADLSGGRGAMGMRDRTKFSETLITVEEIEEFNQSLLEELNERLGGKVVLAPKKFLKEKSRFGVSWKYWDLKALDCDLYVYAKFEGGSHRREASFRLSPVDTAKEAAYIPVSVPSTSLTLFHKRKRKKKGKKLARSHMTLIGRHKAEFAPGKKPVDLIKPRVLAILDGREPEDNLETEYFPWVADLYAGDAGMLEKGFKAHAEMLRDVAPDRLMDMIPLFMKRIEKKLKK